MSTKIDHIGVAVFDLEPAIEFYREHLNLELKEVKELPDRGLKIAFFQVGETLLELLAPLSEDSQVSKFLAKNGEGIHHIAFSTPDINAHIATLTEKGVRMATPTASIGAEGYPIAFLHPKASHGVLTEIIEKK
jgi:methylmalonyl-CoA epimerase